MKTLLLFTVTFYRKYISPFLPGSCRFHPTCSSYCEEAVEKHGVSKGMWISVKRIGRCHPFHPGGYDPVELPDKSS